jgi:hypothetical protein
MPSPYSRLLDKRRFFDATQESRRKHNTMTLFMVQSSCRGSQAFLFPNRPVPFTETLAPRQNRQTVDGTGLFGEDEMAVKGYKKYPVATCHPEKESYCNGLCKNCYDVLWRDKNRDKINKQSRDSHVKNKDRDNARQREWKRKNRDKVLENARIYRENKADILLEKHREYNDANRETINEKSKEFAKNNPEKRLYVFLNNRYGLSQDDYYNMLESQNHVCAICGNPGGKKRLCVDHDHDTGKVRALLCDGCNVGIGRFKDNPDLVEKAAFYLRKHKP